MKRNYGTLQYDDNAEVGEIKMKVELPATVVSMDILSDWIQTLHDEYWRISEEVFPKGDQKASEAFNKLNLKVWTDLS
jgi:hypothetical protein